MCASRFPATTPIFLTAQQNEGTFYPGNNHQFGHGNPSFPHPHHQTTHQFPQQMPLSSAAPYSPYYSPFYQNTSQQAQQQWETEERHHVVDEPVDLPHEPMTSYLEEEQGQQNAQNVAAAPPSDMPSIPGAYAINAHAYDPMYWHPRPIFLPLLTPQPQVPQYYQRSRSEIPPAEPRVAISLFARRAQRNYRRNRTNNRGNVKDVACQYNPEDFLPVTDDTPAATASEETEVVQDPLDNKEELEKISSPIPEEAASSLTVSDAFQIIREAEREIESLQAGLLATSLLGNGDASGQFDDVEGPGQGEHQSGSSKEEVKSYPVKSWMGVHGFNIGASENVAGIVSLQAGVSGTNLRRNDVADGQFDDAAEFDSDTVDNLFKNITPPGSSTSPKILPTLNTAFLEGVPVPVSPSPLLPIPEETGGQAGRIDPQDVLPVPNPSVKCAFCKSNGETSEKYSSHAMVNANNETTCPILTKYVCPVCGKTGKEAHTEKYCPSLIKNRQNGRKKKRHNATGNRVNLKF